MDALERLVRAFEGRVGVDARHLGSGETVIAGEVDRPFPAGSGAELLVLLADAEAAAASTIDARVEGAGTYRDARCGSGVLRRL